MTDALFDVEALYVPALDLSPAERRRERQAEAAAGGFHPLYAALGVVLRLHPDSGPFDDRTTPGLRCGSCRFRRLHHGGARSYPKCLYPNPDERPAKGWPRVTHGPGTDVSAFWPGCELYEPKENPDA